VLRKGRQQHSIKEILIGTTSSGISHQLRDIYTYKWKVRNGKIEMISFFIKFVLNCPLLSISRCRSRYEADLSVSYLFYRVPTAEAVLWNAMMLPLTNMTIYGVIWYQGMYTWNQ
jgi:hypothetical protein